MPNCARQICLACIAFAQAVLTAMPIGEAEKPSCYAGEFTRILHNAQFGERASGSGDFEIESTPSEWAFRMFETTGHQHWKLLVASDAESTFSSAMFRDVDSSKADLRFSYANFEHGPLPNKFEDRAAAQILALIVTLSRMPELSAAEDLPASMIPATVRRLMRREGAYCRVRIAGKAGGDQRVEFWAIKDGEKLSSLEHSPVSYLCALLEIPKTHDKERNTKLYKFTTFSKQPDLTKTKFESKPIVSFQFTLSRSESVQRPVLGGVAFNSGVAAKVNDYRFKGKTGYLLQAHEKPPFRKTNADGYSTVERAFLKQVAAERATTRNTKAIASMLLLIPAFSGLTILVIMRNRKQKEKQNHEKKY